MLPCIGSEAKMTARERGCEQERGRKEGESENLPLWPDCWTALMCAGSFLSICKMAEVRQ